MKKLATFLLLSIALSAKASPQPDYQKDELIIRYQDQMTKLLRSTVEQRTDALLDGNGAITIDVEAMEETILKMDTVGFEMIQQRIGRIRVYYQQLSARGDMSEQYYTRTKRVYAAQLETFLEAIENGESEDEKRKLAEQAAVPLEKFIAASMYREDTLRWEKETEYYNNKRIGKSKWLPQSIAFGGLVSLLAIVATRSIRLSASLGGSLHGSPALYTALVILTFTPPVILIAVAIYVNRVNSARKKIALRRSFAVSHFKDLINRVVASWRRESPKGNPRDHSDQFAQVVSAICLPAFEDLPFYRGTP